MPLIWEQRPLNAEARAPAGTPMEPLSKQLTQRAARIIAWAGGMGRMNLLSTPPLGPPSSQPVALESMAAHNHCQRPGGLPGQVFFSPSCGPHPHLKRLA